MIIKKFLNFSRKDAKVVVQIFLASLRLGAKLKKFIDNHISNYKLFCCIFHAKPAKLAKAVCDHLRGLGVNSKNIIHNYL